MDKDCKEVISQFDNEVALFASAGECTSKISVISSSPPPSSIGDFSQIPDSPRAPSPMPADPPRSPLFGPHVVTLQIQEKAGRKAIEPTLETVDEAAIFHNSDIPDEMDQLDRKKEYS